ncbi:hypothetical protein D0C16_08680 [Cellvibrio sp. KY-GH-1]|uniref:hypothetical protein n=1 Tax=Cellvibrio sp. KY-GH-1 TaxID=2303332 RepID=UPI0012459B56|nr:hypothetical protein [Cellvibrio sp. KY-GH-1]QEY16049.1 hypothetical protein D0C16_08680 [Cellvibrio sp. KY-GH-1]
MNLLTKLLRIRTKKEELLNIEPQGVYANNFLKALNTTRELKLDTPHVKFQSKRIITENLLRRVPKLIEKRLGKLPIEQVAGQCIAIHYNIKKTLEELFNTELYYTIGYVENQFDNRFYHDKNDIINLLQSKTAKPQLNLHTWLTFPSMEIMDYSLLSTYAVAYSRPDHYFDLLAEHADELKNGIRYHPTIVGEDFLERIGSIKKFIL